jgi:hypothetical protein
VLSVCIAPILATTASAEPDAHKYKEYEVKAAFLYNFLKFVDWPGGKNLSDSNKVTIGIIGDDPFGSATDIYKDKTVENCKLVLRRFEGIEQLEKSPEKDKKLELLKSCHLLFICPSEQVQTKKIIDLVAEHAVLTVGDANGFIESGGIINFLTEENKIRFDINLTAAEKTGLKIRSQLLRLAKTVVINNAQAAEVGDGKQEGN